VSGLLLNFGTILGLWGIAWRLWDRNAFLPGPILAGALVLLAGGLVL
jgi:hypothetical protein